MDAREYRRRVMIALAEREMTQGDLIPLIRETGAYCDGSYLSNILHGKRGSKKVKAAIKEILGVDDV